MEEVAGFEAFEPLAATRPLPPTPADIVAASKWMSWIMRRDLAWRSTGLAGMAMSPNSSVQRPERVVGLPMMA